MYIHGEKWNIWDVPNSINNMQEQLFNPSDKELNDLFSKHIDSKIQELTPEIIFGLETYLPEVWSIKKDLVYKTISCLQSGLENTQSALAEHDFSFGRTTTKNRMWAETLEQEIRDTKDCIKQLITLGTSYSTYCP